MTNNQYLISLQVEKKELFLKIKALYNHEEKAPLLEALERYEILRNYIRNIKVFIDKGLINGTVEIP